MLEHGLSGNSSRGVKTHRGKKLLLLFLFFIYFFFLWLCWFFVAAGRLSLVVASMSYSSLRWAGFSLRWLLLLQSTGYSSCGVWAQ